MISSIPNKSFQTSLLKLCPEEFAPLIAHLINRSLTDGKFPHLFKMAQVLPLLKKSGLDPSQPSQLPADLQPQHYLEDCWMIGLGSTSISTTSTGVGKLQRTAISVPQRSLHRNSFTSTKLLATGGWLPSSAWTYPPHSTPLVRRLEMEFGVTGTALNWLRP